MRKPNLQKLLAKWQKRLRCQDWDLTIGYFSAKELEGSIEKIAKGLMEL